MTATLISALAGAALQPTVRVTTGAGQPASGVTISWTVVVGSGTLSASSTQTGANGEAQVTWTLGKTAGPNAIRATASGLTGSPVTFTVNSTPNAVISGTISLSDAQFAPSIPKQRVAAPMVAMNRPETKKSLAEISGIRRSSPAPSSSARYVPDELVITYRAASLNAPPVGSRVFTSRATADAVGAAIRTRANTTVGRGARVAGVSPALLAARVKVDDPADLDALIAELRTKPGVAAVERNGIIHGYRGTGRLVTNPNDAFYPFQSWHYHMIDLPRAWDITRGSPAVLVAVIDDGIRFDHPDIAPNLTADGRDFVTDDPQLLCGGGTIGNAGDGDGYDADPTIPASYGFGGGCFSAMDDGGHGLHVAGTIGAVGNDGAGVAGVNWTVRIRPIRVIGITGGGTDFDIAQGLLYAAGLPADDGTGSGTIQAASGARVINMSLGGPISTTVMENAVIAASHAGALIVAAAGNDGGSSPNYPAAYPQVLSVSAVGPDGILASYSTFGSTIDIAAPGGDLTDGTNPTFGVLSTWWDFSNSMPVHNLINGTSMAAPHVSGVAALLLAENPGLTAAQLRARLIDYAVDVGAAGPDDQYGAGLVNARNALTQNRVPPRDVYARLYSATTGQVVRTTQGPAYSFGGVLDGEYLVYAGEDENSDGLIGLPGRRWGARGGSASPVGVKINGAGTYPASFTIGFPVEEEPNPDPSFADYLTLGGYLTGTISDPDTDGDFSRVLIPSTGQYTFETHGVSGECGSALNEDTVLGLFTQGGSLLQENDDIDFPTLRLCSRITRTLVAGNYFVGVFGYNGGRYRVSVRAGP